MHLWYSLVVAWLSLYYLIHVVSADYYYDDYYGYYDEFDYFGGGGYAPPPPMRGRGGRGGPMPPVSKQHLPVFDRYIVNIVESTHLANMEGSKTKYT